MEEYKSNSDKSRAVEKLPEKNVEKLISGSAKVRKKTSLQKFTDVFVPDDTNKVKDYIVQDILVPAVKDVILDVVKSLLGVSGTSSKNSGTNGASKISYRRFYETNNNNRVDSTSRNRNYYDCDTIILDNYAEADAVLTGMEEIISTYGLVSIADYYELVGVKGEYTDNKYGWTDLRTAKLVRERDGGYSIKLPRAIPID